MAKLNLSSTIVSINREFSRLERYRNESLKLEYQHQVLIAELIMFRISAAFEFFTSEIAAKLCSNTRYLNGSRPILTCLQTIKTKDNALYTMLNYNRKKPLKYLKWTQARFIIESVEEILDKNEKFIYYVRAYANLIMEMTYIRNHIAHHSQASSNNYKTIISKFYGTKTTITPGRFLVSTTRFRIAKIDEYLKSVPIILHDFASGT